MSEVHTPARPVLPSEQKDFVSLREFEQRMQEMRLLLDERTRYEREILSTRENLLKDAKELQAVEYERRLSELNHAHKIAMENWARSLPREIYEAFLTEFRSWRDKVNADITANNQLPTGVSGLARRVGDLESALQQAQGALMLARFMGFAGVIALLVTFARMAGMVP